MQKNTLIKCIATGFGSGLAPKAPGTFGTLAAIPLYLLLTQLSSPAYLVFLLIATGLSVLVSQAAEGIYAAKDPSCIVIDEWAGFFWTMLFIPPTLPSLFLGFLFFRFFDIVKPFPVRFLQDKLPGGLGVVGDDVMAGIYSNGALRIVLASSLI